jgi:D-beta-D-heptose 7-phosphate kinase/D-beta-D-heptose 1-phosphate adenosyltransferase
MTTPVKALVIGPTLLDAYYMGQVIGLDQTAPIPRVDVMSRAHGFGGAACAAQTLVRMGAEVSFVTALSPDEVGEKILEALSLQSIRVFPARAPNYRNPTKHRVFAGDRLVSRFDTDTAEAKVDDHIRDMLARAAQVQKPDVILLSDYGNAVITEGNLHAILAYANQEKIPVVVDPSIKRMQYYRNVHTITPSRDQLTDYIRGDMPLTRALRELWRDITPKHVVVTRGEQGASLFNETTCLNYPAIPAHCRDSCGAGDAFTAALAYSIGGDPDNIKKAIHLGLAAGAAEVENVGAVPVGAHDVLRKQCIVGGPLTKIVELGKDLNRLRNSVRLAKQKFGVANGVFDLMHVGHADMLAQAAKACDFLVVLVNSDISAERIKRKPINDQDTRQLMLANLPFVDAVVLFHDPTPEGALTHLRPDVLIKGPGNTADMTPGAQAAAKFVVTEKHHDISTTATIQRAQDNATAAAPDGSAQ